MCAVIGTVLIKPSGKDFDAIKRVFIESKIRGMHATGVSYVKDGKVHTHKEAVPADQFNFNFKEYLNEDGNLYLIGHCRYSTSDLEFNQPISNDSISVAHNGVITQELPEHWEDLYGYKCETKNDSELLLHTVEANKSPLVEWADESLAVCELSADKLMRVYRNGKRPLYLTSLANGCIITSTSDIASRANLFYPTMEIPMNVYLTFDERATMMVKVEHIPNAKDLQNG